MSRAWICVGDKTSHGGVVIAGSTVSDVAGRHVARIGDKVSCPKCGTTSIATGDSTVIIDGQPLARHGDKTACGATLIAVQTVATVDGSSGNSAVGIAAPSAEAAFAAMFFGESEADGVVGAPSPAPQSATGAEVSTSQAGATRNAISTNLGPDVDALAAKSPTLQKQLADMQRKGIAIGYGNTGPSVTTLAGPTPSISIDPAYKGLPEATVSQLSHELGHAENPITPDYSSKSAYLARQFDNEGVATMNNIKVTREIHQAGGPAIGLGATHANVDAYNLIYDEAQITGDTAAAEHAIGRIYGANEKTKVIGTNQVEPYNTIYGDWYDKTFPH